MPQEIIFHRQYNYEALRFCGVACCDELDVNCEDTLLFRYSGQGRCFSLIGCESRIIKRLLLERRRYICSSGVRSAVDHVFLLPAGSFAWCIDDTEAVLTGYVNQLSLA